MLSQVNVLPAKKEGNSYSILAIPMDYFSEYNLGLQPNLRPGTFDDLIHGVRGIAGPTGKVKVLEINAHGDPYGVTVGSSRYDYPGSYIGADNVDLTSPKLGTIPWDAGAKLILSSCNTGLMDLNDKRYGPVIWTQALANKLKIEVWVPMGRAGGTVLPGGSRPSTITIERDGIPFDDAKTYKWDGPTLAPEANTWMVFTPDKAPKKVIGSPLLK